MSWNCENKNCPAYDGDICVNACCDERIIPESEQPATAPVESQATGSVLSDDKMNEGVWFKSSVSGGLYRNHEAAGDIDCILVDGVWFDRSE
jgi:hypothetical protein